MVSTPVLYKLLAACGFIVAQGFGQEVEVDLGSVASTHAQQGPLVLGGGPQLPFDGQLNNSVEKGARLLRERLAALLEFPVSSSSLPGTGDVSSTGIPFEDMDTRHVLQTSDRLVQTADTGDGLDHEFIDAKCLPPDIGQEFHGKAHQHDVPPPPLSDYETMVDSLEQGDETELVLEELAFGSKSNEKVPSDRSRGTEKSFYRLGLDPQVKSFVDTFVSRILNATAAHIKAKQLASAVEAPVWVTDVQYVGATLGKTFKDGMAITADELHLLREKASSYLVLPTFQTPPDTYNGGCVLRDATTCFKDPESCIGPDTTENFVIGELHYVYQFILAAHARVYATLFVYFTRITGLKAFDFIGFLLSTLSQVLLFVQASVLWLTRLLVSFLPVLAFLIGSFIRCIVIVLTVVVYGTWVTICSLPRAMESFMQGLFLTN